MNFLHSLIARHLHRNADMHQRRQARIERAVMPEYVDVTPSMWQQLHDGGGFTASTPQPAERELPPQRRYVAGTRFSEN